MMCYDNNYDKLIVYNIVFRNFFPLLFFNRLYASAVELVDDE